MEITEITGGAETFRIQDGDSPAFAQLVEPRARRRRPRERLNVQDRLQGLSVVNVGLGFHYARLLVYLVSILIWMATILIAGLSGAAQSGDTLGLLRFLEVVLIIGMLIVTPLLGLAGSILCLWVPGGSGARPWISLALALDTVLFPLAVVRTLAGLGPTAVLVLMSVSFLLILAAFVFFMIFLSTLAEYLDQPGLSQEAHHLLFKGIALPVAFLMLVVLLYALMHVSPQLFGIPGVILLIIWLVVYLNFLFELLNLISSLRQVLATRW